MSKGWYYSTRYITCEYTGERECVLVEVYPLDSGEAWSEDVRFTGDTPEEVSEWLRTAANDIEKGN